MYDFAMELCCDECRAHLGWYYSGQPRGMCLCDTCHEKAERESEPAQKGDE